MSFIYLGIKDRCYHVFQFPINDDWRVESGVPTWEGIWSYRFNHRDVENRVNRMHALWQLKGKPMSTCLSDDGKGTKKLL